MEDRNTIWRKLWHWLSLILYGKETSAARPHVSSTQVSKLTVRNGKSTFLLSPKRSAASTARLPGWDTGVGDILIKACSFTPF